MRITCQRCGNLLSEGQTICDVCGTKYAEETRGAALMQPLSHISAQQGFPAAGMPQQAMPQQTMPQQGFPRQPQQGFPQRGYQQQGYPPSFPQQPQQMQGRPNMNAAPLGYPQRQVETDVIGETLIAEDVQPQEGIVRGASTPKMHFHSSNPNLSAPRQQETYSPYITQNNMNNMPPPKQAEEFRFYTEEEDKAYALKVIAIIVTSIIGTLSGIVFLAKVFGLF